MNLFFRFFTSTFNISGFRVFSLLLVLGATAPPLHAEPPGIEQYSDLYADSAGDKFLRWYGHAGRSYFIQVSDTSNPLQKWFWAPIIEAGNDEEISHEVDGTADKSFFRLKHTDLPVPPGETLETADFDNDGLPNIDEIAPPPPLLATDPLNPDTDGDSLPDGWEIAHGLDPNDSADSTNLFPGSTLTNLQAFNSGVQGHSNATPTNKDGDACEDLIDAAPDDSLIDWEKPAFEKFAAIEMPEEFIPAAPNFRFQYLELTDDFDVLVSGLGSTDPSTFVKLAGFWKLDESQFVIVSGPDVSYETSVSGSTVLEKSGSPVGMVGTSVLFSAEGEAIDDNFGGAIVSGNETIMSFREELVELGISCYKVHAIGGTRSGRAIVFLQTMYGGQETDDPHQVWAMEPNPPNGTPALKKICSAPLGIDPAYQMNVTKAGWVFAYEKVVSPTGVELPAPAVGYMEKIWSEDLPNGRLIVSRAASSTKVFLLDSQQKFVQGANGTLEGQLVKAVTQWGAFLNTSNELWAWDRAGEGQANSWIPLNQWAGQKVADLVTAGWSLELSSSNPAGGMVLQLTKDEAKPKLFTLLPVDITVRKKGEVAPQNGVLVKKGDLLEIALAETWFDQKKELENRITWKYRQVKCSGLFTEWTSFGNEGKSTKFEYTTDTAGIFQLKAVINAGGQVIEQQYVRKKDEPNASNSGGDYNEIYRKGKPEYFGVTDEQLQINVRDEARRNLGSTAFSRTVELPDGTKFLGSTLTIESGEVIGPKLNKCNIFIYYKASNAGATVPLTNKGFSFTNRFPPGAYDWWDIAYTIPGWTRLPDDATPQPGFVVARPDSQALPGGANPGERWGHVGILDYDGAWIQAGPRDINKYPHLTDSNYQPAGMRKYNSN